MSTYTATAPNPLVALTTLTRVETLLLLREPAAVLFTLALPLVLLALNGSGGNEPNPYFGGAGVTDVLMAGYLVYVMATSAIMGLGETLADYRDRGILRRLRVTPIDPDHLEPLDGVTAGDLGAALDVDCSLEDAMAVLLRSDKPMVAIKQGARFLGVLTPNGVHRALRARSTTEIDALIQKDAKRFERLYTNLYVNEQGEQLLHLFESTLAADSQPALEGVIREALALAQQLDFTGLPSSRSAIHRAAIGIHSGPVATCSRTAIGT